MLNARRAQVTCHNQLPVLMQTYGRDRGGGKFIVMKEAWAPIEMGGRHRGVLRLAFKF